MSPCPLCHHDTAAFHQDNKRPYVRCPQCLMVSVPKTFYWDEAAEKAHYDCHHNDFANAGYQLFLSRTLTPLLAQLAPGAMGLDFGCGEGAVLSQMAAKHGISVANYDLFYHPDTQVLHQLYDFVCLTEVIEHIADAQALIEQLSQLLMLGGILAVMTKRVPSAAAFTNWSYKIDPTHINFYALETFQWIAQQQGWLLEVIDSDVVFFHVPAALDIA
ncbi:class I SAM-dependent methyltransferase [Shewanella livingstonensis]|uniref:Class I SAM-dependent methyltransferase n=1 Tax=Shewanella livingstonensis TaxID=150120 RepID=A0A3G8M257_9GAMM|nr:class I SAM-dependent methyltransferase [Shewanella livingstonensis]AZG75008.1 class I SAM-dependent methyltransferase [Shewanella livingstonensis]